MSSGWSRHVTGKIAILNMFQALYNRSFCEMQTMMIMHNTHTSWDGKPMSTTGEGHDGDWWWETTEPQVADTGKKNCPQRWWVTPDHAYRTKIGIYV
jgi:hypothetical protein